MRRTKYTPKRAAHMISNLGFGSSSVAISRALIGAALGKEYSGSRDIYTALGYPKDIGFTDYYARYKRQDVAKRVVNAPVTAVWKDKPRITDNEDENTPFEKGFLSLAMDLKLFSKFTRADKLAGIGRYSVLFLGFSDVTHETQLKNPVSSRRVIKLLFVQPYSEQNAHVHTYVTDMNNKRFGQPETYQITITTNTLEMTGGSENNVSREVVVHWSRIIHIAEEVLENDLYGLPRLEAIFNRLIDLDRVAGGSGEMFWRGARPGKVASALPDTEMDPEAKLDLQSQFDEYDHGLRRWLRVQGVEIKDLAPQVSDPSKHVDMFLKLISSASGIPVRILTGSERGELASSQDGSNWNERVEERRQDYAEPCILRVFIDRMIQYKVLPAPQNGEYLVIWGDLWALGEKDKAEVGRIKADSIAKYAASHGSDQIVPPEIFLKEILGFSPKQIKAIEGILGGELSDIAEDDRLKAEEEALSQGNDGKTTQGTLDASQV